MNNLNNMNDEQLALLYVKGNNRAFDILLNRNKNKLFTYIVFIVHDENIANDIFQETFVKAISKMHENKYNDTGKFSAWLIRIAHNIIMDNYRSQKNNYIIMNETDNNLSNISNNIIDDNIEQKYINRQIIHDVKYMLTKLPAPQQEVILMRFYQKLSFKEIAEATGVSINTSLGRMRYAIINLRKMAKSHNIILDM